MIKSLAKAMLNPNASSYRALESRESRDEKIETGILPVINNFWDDILNNKALLPGGKQATENDVIYFNLAAAAIATGGKRLGE